jgi:hypothetical protein
MVYRGHVVNGAVVIDSPGGLADGTEVEIHVVTPNGSPNDQATRGDVRPWLKFSGAIKDLPPDASLKVDEVLYGRPSE